MSEGRFGLVRCPGCGGALSELVGMDGATLSSAERVPPMSMCSSCFGVWFEWWAGETGSLCQSLLKLPRTTRAVVDGDSACPRDRTPLVAQPYLDSGPVVKRCPRCMGLFARRTQVDELAKFAEQLPEPLGPIVHPTVLRRLWRLFQ